MFWGNTEKRDVGALGKTGSLRRKVKIKQLFLKCAKVCPHHRALIDAI